MTLLTTITDQQFFTFFWIFITVMIGVFAFMIYTATKNTKRFNKFRKKVKVGDYVNYQKRPVLIEKMDEKTATFSITVSKESLFPLDFKS